ncbi:MAG: 4-(cytidine 5'-diphospho)-2-C-methyl-D-erythritol kinase [Halieaceae bacterium]
MTSLQLRSPAKLNLFLHITGRREDGYHELQTLFQLLDFGDEMRITATDDSALTVSCPQLQLPEQQNLAWRAAELLRKHCKSGAGAHITIDKRIPAGGGLGGGSSNAATVLLALNQLWELGLSRAKLGQLGLKLGADVPLFVHGRSAWAEGIGEQLEPVEIPASHYLVVAPACAVATAEVFSHRQLTRNTSPITIAAFFEGGAPNDCESVVRQLYPEVDKALIWLGKFGQPQLTGTGSCVFSAYASRAEAEAVKDQLPDNWQGFVASGINESPLLKVLG